MKYFKIFIIIFFVFVFIFLDKWNEDKFQILDVYDFRTVHIDLNKNFQKDDDEIFVFQGLELPENLKSDEKFLLTYLLNKEARHILLHKFVTFSEDRQDILLDEKNYKDILSSTNLIIAKSAGNKEGFEKKLSSLKNDNYVLLNTKSKKYHTLNCENGLKSKNYKLIPFRLIPKNSVPCKFCHLTRSKAKEEKHLPLSFPLKSYTSNSLTVFPLGLNDITAPSDVCTTSSCKALLTEINSAKNEILFAIYGIHNQKAIFNALINAQKRGVSIRWVSDFSTSETDYYPDTNKLANYLPNVRFDVNDEKRIANQLMHNKFFIFDSKKVFTGSSNITYTDLTGFNSNYGILINNPKVAEIFKMEFEQMYSGKFHQDKEKISKQPIETDPETQIGVYFSPKDKIIVSKIIPMINSAKSEINIAIFYITHKELLTALVNAHKRNVKIRVINDATNASNKFSIHHSLRSAGIAVKTENYAGKMHSKLLTIDKEYAIIGSMNFTSSGENKNDENVLIIRNRNITKAVNDYFETVWKKIDDKYLLKDPAAESHNSIYSCSDGIDNDFDGKIDKEDKGCFK